MRQLKYDVPNIWLIFTNLKIKKNHFYKSTFLKHYKDANEALNILINV